MGMMQEFRDFAVKGNVIDLAVGVIIGGAFGKIVDSIVKDLIMPVVGWIFGGLDFSNKFFLLGAVPKGKDGAEVALNYKALSEAGAPMFAYGNFITVVLNFLILAFIIFQMVKAFNRMKGNMNMDAKAAPTPEDITLLREIRDSLKR
jgi:large conductance mechanosensitive channel